MTRADFRAALTRRLGNRSDLTSADYDRWIDAALLDFGTRRMTLRELEASSTVSFGSFAVISGRPTDAFAIQFIMLDTPIDPSQTAGPRVSPWSGSLESLLEAIAQAPSAPPASSIPKFFKEYGSTFWFYPTNGGASPITGTAFYYKKPSMGTSPSDSPNIDDYWHKGVEILAAGYGLRDLGDDERANAILTQGGEFDAWLAQRQTPKQVSSRIQQPSNPIRPNGSWIRNRKTGI